MRRKSRLAVPLVGVFLLYGTSPAWAQAPKVFKIGILTDAMVPWHFTVMGPKVQQVKTHEITVLEEPAKQ